MYEHIVQSKDKVLGLTGFTRYGSLAPFQLFVAASAAVIELPQPALPLAQPLSRLLLLSDSVKFAAR